MGGDDTLPVEGSAPTILNRAVGGRLTRLGSTPYHAAKWAVGGFTESLAQELSPFDVKVCALEPVA